MFPYTIYTKSWLASRPSLTKLTFFYARVWPRTWLRMRVCISRLWKINNWPPSAQQTLIRLACLSLMLYIARLGRPTGSHVADRRPCGSPDGRWTEWNYFWNKIKMNITWINKICVNPTSSICLYFWDEWKKSKHYFGLSDDTLITTIDRRTEQLGRQPCNSTA